MDNNLLEPPKCRLEYFGKRSFAAAAPVLWNDLPLHIKQSPSVDIFKSRIKTRLFQLAYFIWLCKCMYVYFMLSIMNRLGLTRSYVTCTFASALVSKGQISIWHICLILKLALYEYHIIIIIILLLQYINMSTVYLFYKAFCILKIKVALISFRWSKARSKAGEKNGLIRPPAEGVPGLNNREIASISSPGGVGVEAQPPLASPLGSKLLWVTGLTPCSAYAHADACWYDFGVNLTRLNIWCCPKFYKILNRLQEGVVNCWYECQLPILYNYWR